ncbi:f-box only protein [Anaeramoeba flamelloides]|uniref:F-box only protein n=1 Tax=Anaeramoeba flamelloides TaxID=1746091 RepID=A0AAV7YDC6_9EUKA|nr:f-box only protein [Anaeramoeba flamelloides]
MAYRSFVPFDYDKFSSLFDISSFAEPNHSPAFHKPYSSPYSDFGYELLQPGSEDELIPKTFKHKPRSKFRSKFRSKKKRKKNKNRENYFQHLPDEILLQIYSYLDKPVYLGFCSCVCKQFNRVSNDWALWTSILKKNQKLLDFEEIRVNYFQPTQLVGRIGLVEYFQNCKKIKNKNQNQKEGIDSKKEKEKEKKKERKKKREEDEGGQDQEEETRIEKTRKAPINLNIKLEAKKETKGKMKRELTKEKEKEKEKSKKREREREKEKEKIRKIGIRIQNNPKQIFVEQLQKVKKAQKESTKRKKDQDRKDKIDKIKNTLFTPKKIFLMYTIGLPFTLIEIGLKLDNIWFQSWPWLIVLIPFFCCYGFILISLSIPMIFKYYKELFLRRLAQCLFLFFIFLFGLTLRIDNLVRIKFLYLSIPFILLIITSIYSNLKTYQALSNRSQTENIPKQYLLMQLSLYFFYNLFLFVFLLSFILLSFRIDFNFPISWSVIFLPFLIGEIISLAGLFLSFVSLFLCSTIFGPSVLVCLSAFIIGGPFTVMFFFTYLNLMGLKAMSWITVLTPLLLPSVFILLFSLYIMRRKYWKN